jgi:hypothetical protein
MQAFNKSSMHDSKQAPETKKQPHNPYGPASLFDTPPASVGTLSASSVRGGMPHRCSGVVPH